jgi:hypothetical protein
MMKLPSSFLCAAAVGAVLFLSGCACPFAGGKCPLRTATAAPGKARATDPFSGHYTGTWRSDVTKHHGRLLCDFTKMDPKHYRADFKAYWGAFNGSYSVVMETQRAGRELRFSGRQDLGKLYGGVFKYEGKAGGGRMNSSYSSTRDHGAFELTREP